MGPGASQAHLLRETAKSAAAGLFGAVVPHLRSLGGADAAAVHAVRDVAVDLAPLIVINALMSVLVPAIVTLRRGGRLRTSAGSGLLPSLLAPAAVVASLAAGGALAALGLLRAAAYALSPAGLAAPGVMVAGAVQAVLVAAVLTPLTIAILSRRPGR